MPAIEPLRTPDGRYIVVRGRLWRAANPNLLEAEREQLVKALMGARQMPPKVRAAAREAVQAAKVALGERGPVWWSDGAPDLNHRLARNTPYAAWFATAAAEVNRARRSSRPSR
jgi:hypothetical protein